MTLKSIIKKCIPTRVTNDIGDLLVRRREKHLARLPISQAFDEVYRRSMWKQGKSLSGVGSEGLLAERYISFVRDYAEKLELHTVLDGGCGDFAVGSKLAPHFTRYTAVDVSSHIIDINRQRFTGTKWQHVTFTAGDMTSMPFPPTDLVLIRQVLQHLTNAQIERILENLEAGSWRRVLITESIPDPVHKITPNLDMPSHSLRTRDSFGSAVYIDQPPFNRQGKRIATIYPSQDGSAVSGGLLVTELSRDP
jgi:hypothetical protein